MNNNMHDIFRVMESASKAESSQRFYEFVKSTITETGQYLNQFNNHARGTTHDFAWCVQSPDEKSFNRDVCQSALKSIAAACKNKQHWELEKNDPQPGSPNFVVTVKDPVSGSKTVVAALTYFEETRPVCCNGWAFDIIN